MVKVDKRFGTELAHGQAHQNQPTRRVNLMSDGALQVGSRLAELLVKMLE